MMGIHYATDKLKKELIDKINESGVPAVNVRYVLCELKEQIQSIEQSAIEREFEEYKNSEKKEEEGAE